jgi:S-DNA-T family DNA segregation ATPase FtsK/SpoIIIE
MEFARHAVEAGAVPIEDAVGGVAVLLHLDDHVALADGVETSAGNEDTVAGFDGDDMKGLFDAAFAKQGFELLARDASFEPRVDIGSRLRVGEIPHLGLGFPAQRFTHVHRRMDLHRQPFAGVKQLDQDGKARRVMVRISAAKNLLALRGPQFVQGRSPIGSVVDDALGVLTIHDLPRLSDGHALGEHLAVKSLQAASTPDAFHGERFKNNWFCVGHTSYFSEGGALRNSFCEPFAVLAAFGKLARIEIFMANKPKGYGTWDAVLGLALAGLAVLLFLALVSYQPSDLPPWAKLIYDSNARSPIVHNLCGVVGAVAAGYLYFFFGAASYLWIIVFGGYGIAKLTTRDFLIKERLGWSFLFVLSGACLLQLQPWFFKEWNAEFRIEGAGGWLGKWVGEKAFGGSLGEVGAPVVLGVIYLTSLVLAIGFHPINVLKRGWAAIRAYFTERERRRLAAMEETERMEFEKRKLARQAEKLERKLKKKGDAVPSRPDETPEPEVPEPRIIDATFPLEKRPSLAEIEGGRKKKGESKPSLAGLRLENYQLPIIDLLDPLDDAGRRPADHDELRAVQGIIIETLAHFGIKAKAGDITRGPTITRFEVYPDSGVRVDRITSLERDIARATRAQRINILAPIPGKDTVGIEIANPSKVKVALREVLETGDWVHSGAKLPLALGKDVYGQTIIADLAKMPHCLVAGTTGSGKSVCINSMIASLLFRYTPEELRFIMIDPKVVEMQVYNDLPHLVTPVVTDPKKVLLALRWVVDEMEQRYQIFAKSGVRNITGFNERPLPKSEQELNPEEIRDEVPGSREAAINPEKNSVEDAPSVSVPREDDLVIPDRMPYIVVIIDELADLMQTAPADVEGAIARITQMARAAGIHLIAATQTPRADVVTGIIKANIPSRIAFQVASGLDSRVILDQKGAEKLLGQGDMLYLPPATSTLVRAQGVLVTDDEIRRLVNYVCSQSKPRFEPSIHERLNSPPPEEDVTEEDEELIQKVLEIMKQERRASTSLFQRRLRLGYTRAARLVDVLEQRGILGPRDGAKDREILVDLDSLP